MQQSSRRWFLLSSAFALLWSSTHALGATIRGALPFFSKASPPERVVAGTWKYFTSDEATLMEALVDRIIPTDPETPGGKDIGCVVFIDAQLAGPYGDSAWLYTNGPFHKGTKEQGPQSADPPAVQYRKFLAALDHYCRSSGTPFVRLGDDKKDEILHGVEDSKIKFDGIDAKAFFATLVKDTQRGFFADPIYGGNKDMAAWKMIGFPGARYDYRDWIDRHNERYPNPPVGIADHPTWSASR
ncbi:MAG TPA: gluconate 2-dehydrogenase subunit 3 family protein [Magnetospirillaceae bacterium]|jgi:gluconate 2-dehydrogenase gamma chain